MVEINTSLTVVGKGQFIGTSFERPLTVKGKSIGLKSVSFGEEQKLNRYSFHVRDEYGDVHKLFLRPYFYQFSDDVMDAMFEAMLEFCMKTNKQPPKLSKFTLTVIHYGESGLRVVQMKNKLNENVLNRFRGKYDRSNDNRFAYVPHEIEAQQETELPDEPHSKPVLLFCDVIKPTYINGVERQLLDVIETGGYFKNTVIQFHQFLVDKLMHISFYFQTVDGETISFATPAVIHLIVKNNNTFSCGV